MTKTKLTQFILGGILSTGLIVSSFSILASPAPAEKGISPAPHQTNPKNSRDSLLLGYMAKKADLSPEQKAQVRTIMEANRVTIEGIQSQMHDNQLKIRKLALSNDKDKEAKIETLAKTQGELVSQMIVNNAKVADEMNHILKPKQIEQLMGTQHGQKPSK